MASAIKDQTSAHLQIWPWIILFLIFPALLLSVMAQPYLTPSVPSCSEELVLISPCLPFISEPPNNLSDTVPSKCCDAFSSVLESSVGICLCYLLREPQILGFPVNVSKFLSLSSVCPIKRSISLKDDFSDSKCKGNSTLPPLRSTDFPRNKHSADQAPDNSSSPVMSPTSSSSPHEFNRSPPSLSSSAKGPLRTKEKVICFVMFFFVSCFQSSLR